MRAAAPTGWSRAEHYSSLLLCLEFLGVLGLILPHSHLNVADTLQQRILNTDTVLKRGCFSIPVLFAADNSASHSLWVFLSAVLICLEEFHRSIVNLPLFPASHLHMKQFLVPCVMCGAAFVPSISADLQGRDQRGREMREI